MSFNRLLERQIKRSLSPEICNDPAIIKFLQQVSESYDSFERDKALLENAFKITEAEYSDLNQELHESHRNLNVEIVKTLNRADKLISSFADITEYDLLFENIKQQIEALSQSDSILLYLFDDDENKLKLVFSQGYSIEEQKFAEENAMDFVPGYVFNTGQVAWLNNETINPTVHYFNSKINADNLSSIFVPIKFREKTIGSFGIQCNLPNAYDKRLLASMKVFASLTSNAYISIKKNYQFKQKYIENEKLSILAKSTIKYVIYCDKDAKITWVNKSFEEGTGYFLSEIVGKKPGSFLYGPDTESEKTDQLRSAINERKSCSLTITNYTKSRQPYKVNIQLNPVFDDNGELINFVSIQQDVTENEKYKAELQDSRKEIEEQKKFYENILNNIPLDIAVFDQQHKYLFLNKEAINSDEIRNFMIGRDDFDYAKLKGISSEFAEYRRKKFEDAKKSGNQIFWLDTQVSKEGGTRYKERRFHPYDKYVIGYGVEVTEFKNQELLLSNSLEEKETLLGEVHHRVKNNLALVIGLIEMQGNTLYDEGLKFQFNSIKNRIYAMSLIHEKLYKSSNFAKLGLKSYIEDLIRNLSSSFNSNDSTSLNFDIEEIFVNMKIAIPIALIVNEAVTNAYKYAFKDTVNGILTVQIKSVNEKIYMQISDNGPGISESIDLSKIKSLGFKLINIFVRQIKGSIEYIKKPGLTLQITFTNL
ncbi:MAG: histidine kinase dimerization/phosphoacceptor domain -containing protein [Bacteroidota bacterium]